MRRLWISIGIALGGVAAHMGALALADRWVKNFPTIPDVIIDHWPSINLFAIGEAVFAIYILIVVVIVFRYQRQEVPKLLVMLGIYYAVRGVFLLLLPIGAPHGAPALASRFVLYPYANHAYFPGGHVGLMYLFAQFTHQRPWRLILKTLAILFGIGTLLAKAHYSADLVGGLLLSYAVFVWGERHLRAWTLRPTRSPS